MRAFLAHRGSIDCSVLTPSPLVYVCARLYLGGGQYVNYMGTEDQDVAHRQRARRAALEEARKTQVQVAKTRRRLNMKSLTKTIALITSLV